MIILTLVWWQCPSYCCFRELLDRDPDLRKQYERQREEHYGGNLESG